MSFLIMISFISFISSCQSHEQKADSAFDLVKEEKMMNDDTGILIPEVKKIEIIKKTEEPDDWSKYKVETEKKIVSNEIKIRAIKNIPNADAKLFKKISALEQQNTDLRRQLNEYAESLKLNLEKFKFTMKQDMEAINSDLNDLTAANKK